MWKFCRFLILFFFLINSIANAQGKAWGDSLSLQNSTKLWTEISAFASTSDRTPFWLQTNVWGTVPVTGEAVSLSAGWEGKYYSDNKKWQLSSGLEGVGNLSKTKELLLPQMYVAFAFKNLELYAGRRKQFYDIGRTELGSGAYLFSSNAMPVPVIQLSVKDYVPVPFTGKWLHFKAAYADGWFEKGREITSELKLHNKSLYLRIGKPLSKLKFHAGFNHAVQWGGKSPYETKDGHMPKGSKNYWYVISGIKPDGRIVNGSVFDNTNRVGNHLASIDFAFEWNTDQVNIFLYRQQVVEDGSLYHLLGVKDGLTGLQIRSKRPAASFLTLKTFVAEYLYTKDQGGDIFTGTGMNGRDNYFNNSQVRDGWSYFGRTIGTPFITPDKSNLMPQEGGDSFTNNNRVGVLHLGLGGTLGDSEWTSKLSFSSNEGTYNNPFPEPVKQFSGLLSLRRNTDLLGQNTKIGLSLAIDDGQLYKPSAGLMLTVRKDFL